jgi:hypothetical protein
MSVRAQARRAGGDLVLAGPQSAVLRLLDLRDVASRGLVSASVDEVVSDAGSAPAAHVTPGQRMAQLSRRPGPGSCHQRCSGEGRL